MGEANFYKQLKHPQLLLPRHGLDQRLVAVA
jgi:hypothetical protein